MRTQRNLSLAIAALLLLVSALLTSCSEIRNTLPAASSNTMQVHDDNWDNNPASASFHGAYLKSVGWGARECQTCHGANLTGGTSGKSCFGCHASYPHADGFASASGHGTYLYNQNYPLSSCQTCHGATYAGGTIANVTCMRSGCHVNPGNTPRSPEACNTCHGDFAAASSLLASAPPKSVTGLTATTVRGVGAHQKHLATGTVGVAVKCQECHSVPAQLSSTGHLGTLPAEVAFNDKLSQLVTGGGTLVPRPSYDPTSLKCNNTYCHGNWQIRKATSTSQFAYSDSVIVGLNYSPAWTNGSADASCGSCHGLPPKGHIAVPLSTCGSCHFGIVSTDGKITDKAKHINGKVNVFDQEYSF
jgi:predicted CxxxxCH...CXXCH cytochrome family protein